MSAQGPNRANPPETTSTVWETPPDFFAWRHGIWGFDIDAAADERTRLVPVWFGPGSVDGEDALDAELSWYSYGDRFWCNPPYGRDIMHWLQCFERQSKNGAFIETLIPASTGTKWFSYCREKAVEIELLTGRVEFWLDGKRPSAPNRGNTSDSMLVRWRRGSTGGATIRLTDWRKAMKEAT